MTILAPRVEIGHDGVAVEGFVGDETIELVPLFQRRDTDGVEAMARQELKAHKIAKRIGQREDLGGQATLGAADGLALIPPRL